MCELLPNFKARIGEPQDILNRTDTVNARRIYLGSYFCPQVFCALTETDAKKWAKLCEERGKNITLVVPVATQKNLERVKKHLTMLLESFGDSLDELTVNDPGMLHYAAQLGPKLTLGRLFSKDTRDPRYIEDKKREEKPDLFNRFNLELIQKYRVTGADLDAFHDRIDFSEAPDDFTIGIHTPYTYMSTAQICQFASSGRPIDKKFRPNAPCALRCADHFVIYEPKRGGRFYRLGRTVYYDNHLPEITGCSKLRVLHFPFIPDEYVGEELSK